MNEYTSVDTFQPDEKTAFLDSASILATGKDTSGAPVTANIPMNEFGGGNINSISLDGNGLEPDSNKNVNIPVGDGLTVGDQGLSVANPLPPADEFYSREILGAIDGSQQWMIVSGSGGLTTKPGDHGDPPELHVNIDYKTITCDYNDKLIVNIDDETITTNEDDQLTVATPVPGTDEATSGDVLTYDGDDIVWSTPFTPPPADNYDNNAVLTVQVDNHGNPSYQWERRVQVVYAGTGLCETSSSAADVQATLAIDTYDAHNGDVMCYDSNREVFWSDRVTLLEARVAALEEALGGNRFTVNGDNPTVNGDTPTVG